MRLRLYIYYIPVEKPSVHHLIRLMAVIQKIEPKDYYIKTQRLYNRSKILYSHNCINDLY